MKGWRALCGALALLALLASPNASAGSGFNCNLVLCVTLNAGDLAFGNYAPLSGQNRDSAATVTVSAKLIVNLVPVALPYTLSISAGTGTLAQRQLAAAGGQRLNYNIYTDTGYASAWGATPVPGSTAPFTGTSSHTIYGRIPASQTTVVPGDYADTLMVTINF